MEKLLKPLSGYRAALIALLSFFIGFALIVGGAQQNEGGQVFFGVLLLAATVFLVKGLMIIDPNYSIVLTFFGKYVGTVRENGLQFVNPFYSKLKVSLRMQSIESTKLKVNDKLGNPIEIAAVILYQVEDTYKAVFDVTSFNDYIRNQSEAAVRHLATTCPYDNIEDEKAHVTLRDGGEQVIEMLEQELNHLLAITISKNTASKTHTFQKSMIKHRNYLFPCLYDLDVPPDNNASERAIRNIKVKQKISGQFKSGQHTFCVLRSIIDTLRKRELDVFFFLKQIMAN